MIKSETTEQKILEAAREVFTRKGLGGARMQEIADEAGINKALLHYYFRSKEKLFDRIFLEAFRMVALGLISAMESDLPFRDKLKLMIDSYIINLTKNPYLPGFVLFEMNQNPEKLEGLVSTEIADKVPNFIVEVLQEISAGNIRLIHPVHLLLNLIGMIVFPFAARPFLSIILKKNIAIEIDDVLEERADVIYDFVCNALFINPKLS